jgi:nucleoside-diphosphate-sugar epimerase
MVSGAVLVTGANGFVGRVVCEALAASGRRPRRVVRTPDPAFPDAAIVGDIGSGAIWHAALEGASEVVHLAARTHVLRESAPDPIAEYRRVNVAGTEGLARAAAARGIRRLVFVSSVKVNGESTGARPCTEDDAPRPEDPYGISKWEAEQALGRVAAETGLEITVLRPPLVYGPGVKGNFLRLMSLVARGIPLPLAAIENRRSLLYVGNLADAVVSALHTPQAAGRTYLVSDGEDVSTPDLVRSLAQALGAKPHLFTVPLAALRFAAMLTGRRAEYARLAGSLQVDNSRIRRELQWAPRFSLARGLEQTARWYHSRSA